MKKYIFILMALVLGTVACNDVEQPSPKTFEHSSVSSVINSFDDLGVMSNGRHLIFENDVKYNNLLQDLEIDSLFYARCNSYNYISYFAIHSAEISENEYPNINDNFLAHLLSKDLTIQIGQSLYLLDPNTQTVFSTDDLLNEIDYNKFISKDFSGISLQTFSFNDDILDIDTNALREKRGRTCANGANNTDDWFTYAEFKDVTPIYSVKDRDYKFKRKFKEAYEGFGIYKNLYTEFCHKEAWWGTYDNTSFSIGYEYSYTDKKGNTGSQIVYTGYNYLNYQNSTGTNFYDFLEKSKKIIHYRSSRCLEKGKIKSWGFFRDRYTLKPTPISLAELTFG